LNVVRYSVEVKCPAGDIPDSIEVDISSMDIGDSVHISDVKLPKGVKPTISDRDFTIATLIASRAAVEETEDGDDVDAANVPATEQTSDED
jgi:large subunit ribosomal protein L25